MIYEILDENNIVINTINAELSFVAAQYPGRYRDITPPLESPVILESTKTLEEKVDELTLLVKTLVEGK